MTPPSPRLKPFFSFYGSKWRAARFYPRPVHDRINEPFAGSAGYALMWHDRRVYLWDVDPCIHGIWDYLIKTPESEILRLPDLDDGHVPNTPTQEARWLMGFWTFKAATVPHEKATPWMKKHPKGGWWGDSARERIAKQQTYIRHWTAKLGPYHNCDRHTATWFVDPPYAGKAGRAYLHNVVDYTHLADWCEMLPGQVIVCEGPGATWMPFTPLHMPRAHSIGKHKPEEQCWSR